jgi:hypothetical protein
LWKAKLPVWISRLTKPVPSGRSSGCAITELRMRSERMAWRMRDSVIAIWPIGATVRPDSITAAMMAPDDISPFENW